MFLGRGYRHRQLARLTGGTESGLWPTPDANCWKQAGKPGQRRGQLNDPAMGVCPTGGQLNAEFVTWLMGYPKGWTLIGDAENGPACPE